MLNTLNTRLDAPIIAFSLDHGDAKVVIVDREFSKVMKDALARATVKPLVIDYDDPEFSGAGERIGSIEYEEFLNEGDPASLSVQFEASLQDSHGAVVDWGDGTTDNLTVPAGEADARRLVVVDLRASLNLDGSLAVVDVIR